MADLRDFTKKNPIFVGTDGVRLPTGNSAQRVASANVAGTLRYNTDLGGMELYSPTGWVPLAAPPSISTVTPSVFTGESGTEFTINGSNFSPDVQVYFITANATNLLASTVTYVGTGQIKATTPRNITIQEEPISVRVNQQSGVSTKVDCIDSGGVPNWITTAGTLGSIFGANTVNVYVSATDPEGTSVTYQITSGSLPGGLNFTTANGLIQGLASSVLANTTYNFTIKANDTVSNNTDRSFSYTVLNRAPVINTAAGSLGTIYSGNAASASISAYDPDGGQLTYSVSSGTLPVNSSLGSANGVITGTPVVVTTNTTYSFTITSTDEGSLTASNNYTYTVLNRPPLWNTAATLSAINGADIYTPITVNAYDPDGGSVTYSLTSGSVPSGLSFVSANATITGTPDEVTDNTTSTFTVTVTDPGSDANARTFSVTVTPIIDNQFSNTVLLLKTAGNTVIADASANNLSLIPVADSRGINFSPFNTSWSNFFDSSTTTGFSFPQHADYSFGTGDFTVEAFIYISETNSNGNYPIAIYGWGPQGGSPASYASWHITIDSLTTLKWYRYDGGTETVYNFGATFAQRTWYHVAITRSGTSLRGFVNGQQVGTTQTSSTSYNLVNGSSGGSDLLYVGKVGGGGAETFPGYISNFRVVKGTAVYTANTSPITSPLTAISGTALLTCQSNRIKDSSNNNATATHIGIPQVVGFSPFEETDTTTGSIYFDGTGDYIGALPGDILDFGTSEEFSIEFFAYFNSVPTSFGLIGNSATYSYIALYDSTNSIYSGKSNEIGSAAVLKPASAVAVPAGTWHHICFARRSGVHSIYLNGTRIATRSSDTTTYDNGVGTIGYNALASATAMNGFMSNLRILTGASAYDSSQSTLTVPTSPVANISGTRLLTFQNRQPHNNHGFQDTSTNKSTITRFGNTTQGTFTPFSADPGKWSTFFNSSAATDTLSFSSNAAYNIGTGNFTVEFWLNPLAFSGFNQRFFLMGVSGTTNLAVEGQSAGSLTVVFEGTTVITYSWAPSSGTWYHVAVCRVGSTVTLYINGVSVATATSSTSISNNIVNIGSLTWASDFNVKGYLSNVRFSANTAFYTSNFTPSTTPLTAITGTTLLTCQSNYFVDNSTLNALPTRTGTPSIQPFAPFAPNAAYSVANTGGSAYFDGSGDSLSLSSTSLNLGSSDFTIETWVYATTTERDCIIGSISDAAGLSAWMLMTNEAGSPYRFYCRYNGGSTLNYLVGSGSFPVNQWTHFAVTRNGANLRIFSNGIQIGTTSTTLGANSIDNATAPYYFGRTTDDTANFTGYLSGTRVVVGTALYTQNFAPAVVPPTAITNTRMLTNFTNAAIIDYTGKNTIETVGDAKSNNSTYKFTPGSMYFDGTGDYLVIPANKFYDFGTGDFTIECWVRLITIGTAKMLVTSNYNAGTGAGGWALIHRADISSLSLSVNSNVTYTKSWSPTAGIWYHVSVSRLGTNLRFFIDGTQIGTTSTSSDNITGSSTVIVAGNSTSNLPIDANISDLRITRSARYTTNFTAPTRSFPTR